MTVLQRIFTAPLLCAAGAVVLCCFAVAVMVAVYEKYAGAPE